MPMPELDIDLYTTKEEKQKAVKGEFIACRNDFMYYADRYAKIRHPNAGVISMDCFDYQKDVAVPITIALRDGRTDKAREELAKFKHHFNYKKWRKEYIEMNLDLLKVIPKDLHNHYSTVILNPSYHERIDQIILKSRQTGISTIFQQVTVWFTNFFANTVSLVVSMTDREAKKFLQDSVTSYNLVPWYLRSKRIKTNDHELWTSLTGDKAHRSILQALPPTADAGRSYSPNLVILDEFAAFPRPMDTWTSISMSVSGGGIVAIISTPKGVGNLFHSFWTSVGKDMGVYIKDNPLASDDSSDDSPIQNNTNFRPCVLHWSQLPESEFTRRGFTSAMKWYEHMKNLIAVKNGEKAVAQELDLKFLSSGDTIIPGTVLEILEEQLRTNTVEPLKILDKGVPGLVIYKAPEEGEQYVIGADVGEGIGQDYSAAFIMRVPNMTKLETAPEIVAEYVSNKVSPKNYGKLIFNMIKIFNNAWALVERNNAGMTTIEELIERLNPTNESHLVLPTYVVNKMTFRKDAQGWDERSGRQFLLAHMQDYVVSNKNDVFIPYKLFNEFLTFIDNGKRWQHTRGYNDDIIFAYSLALMCIKLLTKYKQWILDQGGEGGSMADVDPEDFLVSTSFMDGDSLGYDARRETRMSTKDTGNMVAKSEIDIEDLKHRLQGVNKEELQEKRREHGIGPRNPLSHVIESDDDGDDMFIF